MARALRRLTPTKNTVDLLAVLLLAVVAIGTVAYHVDRYTRVSPVDELQHIDYLYRAPAAPAYGDKVQQNALREQVCRGIDIPDQPRPHCSKSDVYDPDVFQERGYSTASMNSPTYYTLSKLVALPIKAISGSDSLVTGGRLAGGLWLAIGLALTYFAAVRRGISRAGTFGVLLLITGSPAVIFPSSTLSPDSMALMAGGMLLLALTRWEQKPSKWVALAFVLIAMFVTSIKLTFILAVGAVSLYLLLRAWTGPEEETTDTAGETTDTQMVRRHRVHDTALALVTSAAALVTGLSWMLIQGQRKQMDPNDLPDMATRFLVPEFPWHGFLESGLQLISPISYFWVLNGDPYKIVFCTTVASMVVTAGVVTTGLFRTGSRPASDLGSATLIVAVVGCLGLVALNYLSMQSYFGLPPRYGSALTALMAIAAASLVRDRPAKVALVLIAVFIVVLNLMRISTIAWA